VSGGTLAIHSGALGDLILFGRLCERLPGDVTLVAGRAKAELLRGLGVVARAIDFDSLPMHEAFSDRPLDECQLPRLLVGHGRLVSCFGSGDRKAELRLAAMCGADSAAFLPIRPEAGFGGHLLELWGDLLGIAMDDLPRFAWAVPDAWKHQAAIINQGIGIPRQDARATGARPVVIHPGSGGVAKCWPLERFVELAGRLKDRGQDVLWVVGPAEVERWGEGKLDALRRQWPLLENPGLESLAGLLAQCRVYVGNDSGVSHLAAAVGAPSFVLFGPSNATHFAPLGPCVKVIQSQSLTSLTVEEVETAGRASLSRRTPPSGKESA